MPRAPGPATRRTGSRRSPGAARVVPSRGAHIVIRKDRLEAQGGMTLRIPGRVVFIIPWPNHWIIGTTDHADERPPERPTALDEDVDELLGVVNRRMTLDLSRADILGTYAGLRPLVGDVGGSTVKASREHKVTTDPTGIVRIGGGKYTTYRIMARDTIDAVLGAAAKDRPSGTAELPLVGAAPLADLALLAGNVERETGLPATVARRLVSRHGTEAEAVVAAGRAGDLLGVLPGHGAPRGGGGLGGHSPSWPPRSTTSSAVGCVSPRSSRIGVPRSRPRVAAILGVRARLGSRRARPPRSRRTSPARPWNSAFPVAEGAVAMADDRLILALDQGTTSSRAIAFGRDGIPVASAQRAFEQRYPQPGHVTHDPEAIWDSQLAVAREVVAAVGGPERIAAIGIANQRETTVVWDRATGLPVADAIVWQSRITAPACEALRARGLETTFRERTGLPHRRLLLRPEDRPHPRRRGRTAVAGRAGRAGVRHDRHVPCLAADRWPGPRHGRLKCQPDAALRHPRPALGRGAAGRRSASPRRSCPTVGPTSGVVGGDRCLAVRAPDPDRGPGGRPAGGHVRAGMPGAGFRQDDLRDRRLPHPEHGSRRGRVDGTA